MIATCKKLVTDIQRDKDLDTKLPEYAELLGRQYNCYATVKGSMNYYTMKEVCDEQDDKNTDVCKYFALLTGLLDRHLVKREAVDEDSMEAIAQLRSNVEYKMHILTAYTDAYEIYEYVLNRVEAAVRDEVVPVDAKGLSEKMFDYVFAENDTVVINSKLQLLMAQLPVRMTKNKFYDIINSTLNIYEEGETTSVDEFVDMLRSAVLLKKPKGFETEYPFLYHVYTDLAEADYAALTLPEFEDLTKRLNQAATIINNEVSAFMLLQEVINDVYTILLTIDAAYEKNEEDVPGYAAALRIIKACVKAETHYTLDEISGKLTADLKIAVDVDRLPPLFASQEDYDAFIKKQEKNRVLRSDLATYKGKCFLGVDAGSTTTKVALVAEDGSLLYDFYSSNDGSPLRTTLRAMKDIYTKLPEGVEIVAGCSTGYGEALIKSALMLDYGEVETIAHYTAAAFFDPDVDCILDIGG